ncbi:MAG: hypothetical protein ABI718_15560 [Acidobacteriota bacterium]
MHLRKMILSTAVSLMASLPLLAAQSDLVIPAAATGPGAQGSSWQTEVTLHNAGNSTMALAVVFHDASGTVNSAPFTLAPRTTTIVPDILSTKFGLTSGLGALVITASDADQSRLAVSTRIFNTSATGEFGQDVPAVQVANSPAGGDTVVLAAPSNPAAARFNAGLYAIDDARIRWTLLRSNGERAGEIEKDYTAGTHTQYGNAVSTLFSVSANPGDVLHATIESGHAVLYGSAINQITGDPTFVPGIRTREELALDVLGIDLDEDGTVDVFDANHDGVLDQPVEVFIALFPNYFRVVANDPEGKPLTFELVNSSPDARLIDQQGTVEWYPATNLKGTSTTLTVRVSNGSVTTDLIVPVLYR